jgi:hypothetical protein
MVMAHPEACTVTDLGNGLRIFDLDVTVVQGATT